MDRVERESRRDSFLDEAEDYFVTRPAYPPELLTAAVEIGGVEPGARLLDVGCGTGEASEWFADRGFCVTAMDRSPEMIQFARRRLGSHPRVAFRCEDFEQTSELSDYAALVSATSYHWLDPESRAERCARTLRTSGALILLWHTHPVPYTGYFERSQPIYQRIFPNWKPPPTPGAKEGDLTRIIDELESSGWFSGTQRRSKSWTRTYDRATYLRLLNTYSDHRLLPDAARQELLADVGTLIDAEFGGVVERPYRTEMIVALRVP